MSTQVTVRGGVVNVPDSSERWLDMTNSGLIPVVADITGQGVLDRKSSIVSAISDKTSRSMDR